MQEAAQEEAAATIVRERAQASNPPTEQRRGTARTAGVPQGSFGQVVEGENKKKTQKEEADEKINANSPYHREVKTIVSKKHH